METILERIKRQLAGQKKLYLFKGGRPALIKSMLASSPTYVLTLFTIHSHLANRLVKVEENVN